MARLRGAVGKPPAGVGSDGGSGGGAVGDGADTGTAPCEGSLHIGAVVGPTVRFRLIAVGALIDAHVAGTI